MRPKRKVIARQLASSPEVKTIYLACRNPAKAEIAKKDLEARTGRSIFKLISMDTENLNSVRAAVRQIKELKEPIDTLVMNAGGFGGTTPFSLTNDGVSAIFAQNVLGHVVLLEELLPLNQLKNAVFIGSEAARGVPKLKIPRPEANLSVNGFVDIITGKAYAGKKVDIGAPYGAVKFVGALWISSLARRNPNVRLLTISPGNTGGTNVAHTMPRPMQIFLNYVFAPLLGPLLGLSHSLETGAAHIVNSIRDESLLSGHFYASKADTLTGRLVDQQDIFSDVGNPVIQDRAFEAVHLFANPIAISRSDS
jgi:NAD(P)-dependent dehydrogenase (short-subunit alcohol dehydrogenase family)